MIPMIYCAIDHASVKAVSTKGLHLPVLAVWLHNPYRSLCR